MCSDSVRGLSVNVLKVRVESCFKAATQALWMYDYVKQFDVPL